MKRIPRPLSIIVLALVSAILGCGAAPIPKNIPTDYDVIVIGAGMGGLSAATHLAVGGMKVLVLEQHSKVGGCTSSFSRGEFNFEISLHEMSLGGGEGNIRNLFTEAGIEDKVELIRIPSLGRSIFPGLEFDHTSDPDDYVASLISLWPDEYKGIIEFHKLMEKMHDEMLLLRNLYLGNPVKALLTKLTVPLRQRTLAKYRNATLREVLDKYFTDERLKEVISQFWMYQGPPPSEQWALIYLIAHYTYLRNGAWQIKGSSQALADAYRDRILELGGEVETSTLVTSIILDDDNDRVRGVETERGERYSSRYVVSNADPYQTFFKMMDEARVPKRFKKKIRSLEPSNSLAGVYLGLDVPFSFWGISDYEIIINTSWSSEEMYSNMMNGRYDKGLISATFYTNLPDPFYAPEGKSTLALHTYSDISTWPPRGDEYYRQKEEMAATLIDVVEKQLMPGLRDHIVVQEAMTPRTIERYTLNAGGVPYGWNFTPKQHKRLPIPSPIDGLYLASAWSWPSHSVTMTQISGYLAAKLILKRNGVDQSE